MRGAQNIERAEQVDVDDGLEAVRRHAERGGREIAGRARHQNIDVAERVVVALSATAMASAVRMSAARLRASPPKVRSRRVAASTLSCDRLTTASLAPASAKASAMPRLMPLVPPATKTVRPLKSNGCMNRLPRKEKPSLPRGRLCAGPCGLTEDPPHTIAPRPARSSDALPPDFGAQSFQSAPDWSMVNPPAAAGADEGEKRGAGG